MKIGIAAPVDIHSLATLFPSYELEDLPSGIGGTIIPTYLSKEFISRGHKVSLYTLDKEIDQPKIFYGEGIKLFVGRYRNRARNRALDFFSVERQDLQKAMNSDDVDIINAHWTYEFALAAQETKKPVIITARDAPFEILRYSTNIYRFIRLLMSWKVISQANYMTAVSDYIAQHLIKNFSYKGSIWIIPNGIYFPASSDVVYRKNNNRPAPIYFSISNGWGTRKNEKKLLEAFSLTRARLPEAELWMFGRDHGEKEAANKWALEKGLIEGVKFIGEVNHNQLLKDLSEFADVLVHPALEESFGNTLIEAMVHGVPVIAGEKSGAVPSVLGYGAAGMLLDVTSVTAMAEGMFILGSSDTFRCDLGEKGRKYVYDNYAISKMIDAYISSYEAVLRKE